MQIAIFIAKEFINEFLFSIKSVVMFVTNIVYIVMSLLPPAGKSVFLYISDQVVEKRKQFFASPL